MNEPKIIFEGFTAEQVDALRSKVAETCDPCDALRSEVARLLVRESELEAKLRNARAKSAKS